MMAVVMTVSMLSLAGVPLTAGFLAKFYVIASGIEAGFWSLLTALVIGSAVSIFYYLRIIFAMSMNPEPAAKSPASQRILLNLIFFGLLIMVLGLGIYPEPLIEILGRTL